MNNSLQVIARIPIFTDKSISYSEKAAYLEKAIHENDLLHEGVIADAEGFMHTAKGQKISVINSKWFKAAMTGTVYWMEPAVSKTDNQMIVSVGVPLYDENRIITGVIGVAILTSCFSDHIANIVVGQTGYCYILGVTGTTIATKYSDSVKNKEKR